MKGTAGAVKSTFFVFKWELIFIAHFTKASRGMWQEGGKCNEINSHVNVLSKQVIDLKKITQFCC